MDVQINLDVSSDEARRANELARELLSVRTIVGREATGNQTAPIFIDALTGAVREVCGEAFVPTDALERLSYLIAAQAGSATSPSWPVDL